MSLSELNSLHIDIINSCSDNLEINIRDVINIFKKYKNEIYNGEVANPKKIDYKKLINTASEKNKYEDKYLFPNLFQTMENNNEKIFLVFVKNNNTYILNTRGKLLIIEPDDYISFYEYEINLTNRDILMLKTVSDETQLISILEKLNQEEETLSHFDSLHLMSILNNELCMRKIK